MSDDRYQRNVLKRLDAIRDGTLDSMTVTRSGEGVHISIGFTVSRNVAQKICTLLGKKFSPPTVEFDDREIEEIVKLAAALRKD